MTPAWRPRHTPALDGVRGAALLVVVQYHAVHTAAGAVFPGAFLSLDVFFVLSGFLITSLLLAEQGRSGRVRLAAFYRRRAWRLLPGLGLACGATLAWFGLAPRSWLPAGALPGDTVHGALYALTYVASWTFAFHQPMGAMGQTWSLSVEEHFYVVWPLLFLLLLRRPTHLLRNAALLTAAAACWPLALGVLSDPSADRLYAGPDTRAAQLLVGCLLGVWMSQPRRETWLTRTPFVTFVVGLYALGVLTLHRQDLVYLYGGQVVTALLSACLVAHLATRESWLTRVLSLRCFTALGEWSYGVYLWHVPLLVVLYPVMGETTPARLLGAAASFGVAAASYRWVERPLLRRHGSRVPRPPAQREPAATLSASRSG